MKIDDTTAGVIPPAVVDATVTEGRTRDSVARLIHERGVQTAAELAERLDLSPAAVRRHLDALVADGVLVEVSHRINTGRRGRPARAYALTEFGQVRFGQPYDELAATALQYLREVAGDDAVRSFAEQRASELMERLSRRLPSTRSDSGERTQALAVALTDEGYAAEAAPAAQGVQLCQHHCPVARVAQQFPELCEAETRALAGMLGTYVQRLATIAHGDGVCTTYVPSGGPVGLSPPGDRPGGHRARR